MAIIFPLGGVSVLRPKKMNEKKSRPINLEDGLLITYKVKLLKRVYKRKESNSQTFILTFLSH